jgi:hypothetical protein
MVDQTKTIAHQLVRALYYARDGQSVWWLLPMKLAGLVPFCPAEFN